MTMDRREFLRLRTSGSRVAELSCERLYMRFVDASAEGRTDEFFAALAREMTTVSELRLTDREWLSSEDLAAGVERALAAYEQGGGRISR